MEDLIQEYNDLRSMEKGRERTQLSSECFKKMCTLIEKGGVDSYIQDVPRLLEKFVEGEGALATVFATVTTASQGSRLSHVPDEILIQILDLMVAQNSQALTFFTQNLFRNMLESFIQSNHRGSSTCLTSFQIGVVSTYIRKMYWPENAQYQESSKAELAKVSVWKGTFLEQLSRACPSDSSSPVPSPAESSGFLVASRERRSPVVIGISGATRSGKSTLAKALVKQLGAHRARHLWQDNTFQMRYIRAQEGNWDTPSALDHSRLLSTLTAEINAASDVPVGQFERPDGDRHPVVGPSPSSTHVEFIIVEGFMAFHDPSVRKLCDVKLWVDVCHETSLMRRLASSPRPADYFEQKIWPNYLIYRAQVLGPQLNGWTSASEPNPEIRILNGELPSDQLLQNALSEIHSALSSPTPPLRSAPTPNPTSRRSALGVLLGVAVGDALGAPVEMRTKAEIETLCGRVTNYVSGMRKLPGRYTDDTQMTLGLALALIDGRGTITLQQCAKWYGLLYEDGRGYGRNSATILKGIKDGSIDPRESGRMFSPEGSARNGAPMRIAPLGVVYQFRPPSELRAATEAACLCTHAHPDGIDSAFTLALAGSLLCHFPAVDSVQIAFPGTSKVNPVALIQYLHSKSESVQMKAKLQLILDAASRGSNDAGWEEEARIAKVLMGEKGIMGVEAVSVALWSFLCHTEDPRECVISAANYGGDVDSFAGMAGGLCGALHGPSWIPDRWLSELENSTYGRDFIVRLSGGLEGVVLPPLSA